MAINEACSSISPMVACMASSSLSYNRYEVFLSFRGKDTRTNFTAHLYRALKQAGILTFRDDDEITRGEQVADELEKAIKQSQVSIIIFSESHASSTWCLDELVMIMERKHSKGHKVLPVFYGVQPSQVREQTGSFKAALMEHECNGVAPERISKWRAALYEVAGLAGRVLKDHGDEPELIDNIVNHIENILKCKKLRLPSFIVGIDYHIKIINCWLHDQSVGNVLLLYGTGGSGKTTIAQVIYNMSFKNFEASSFVADIGRAQNELGCLVRLQEQLLRDITGRKQKVDHVDFGIMAIQKAIGCKRVLIVLDDVSKMEHLDALFAMASSLCAGSKIIITSTHKHLVKPKKNVWMKEVLPLSFEDSLKLFSWHAFKQETPEESYYEYSKSVVNYCSGLPLALKVFGSYLSGMTQDVWRSALEDLKSADEDNKVEKILRLSYDSLPGQCEKDIFLDIVCFLVGTKVDYAIKVLEGCGHGAVRCRLQNLENRCLITIHKEKRLRVHQLLQDVGREVIYQKSPKEPWRRSRLWGKDAYEVVKLGMETETIEGMTIKFPIEDKFAGTSIVGSLSRKNPSETALETLAFEKMPRLKFLMLVNIKLKGAYKYFPGNLKWFCWHGYTEEFLPQDLNLENLVGLDMRNSNLNQLWKKTKVIENLKVLNLKNCKGLIKTPDFRGLLSLNTINLRNCISLVEVHESIGDLESLIYLNLKNCESLENLPRSIGKLKSLEKLLLKGCVKLGHHQINIEKMESAVKNDDDRSGWGVKPSYFTIAKSWLFWLWNGQRKFSLSGSRNTLPQYLVKLDLSSCNVADDKVPSDLTSFSSLRKLDLSSNPITGLPKSIISLTKLKVLNVTLCYGLQSLPPLPPNLMRLSLVGCWLLKKITCIPNNDLLVIKTYCSKAVKLERSCNLGLFKYCGFLNLESSRIFSLCHNGVRYFRMLRNFTEYCVSTEEIIRPLQIVHGANMSFLFLPARELLDCYPEVCKSYPNDAIIACVPPFPDHSIWGWSICVTYQQCHPIDAHYFSLRNFFSLEITNFTKDMGWSYSPSLFGIGIQNEDGSEMSWVTVWHCETFLTGGDWLAIRAQLGKAFQVKKIGIRFLCRGEEEGPNESMGTNGGIMENEARHFQFLTDLEGSEVNVGFQCFKLPTQPHGREYTDFNLHSLPY